MNEKNYRLFVGKERYYFATFEAAQSAALSYVPDKSELRIEVLVETTSADFWAYEYKSKQWVPS